MRGADGRVGSSLVLFLIVGFLLALSDAAGNLDLAVLGELWRGMGRVISLFLSSSIFFFLPFPPCSSWEGSEFLDTDVDFHKKRDSKRRKEGRGQAGKKNLIR